MPKSRKGRKGWSRWTNDEQKLVDAALAFYESGEPVDCTSIAKLLPGRSPAAVNAYLYRMKTAGRLPPELVIRWPKPQKVARAVRAAEDAHPAEGQPAGARQDPEDLFDQVDLEILSVLNSTLEQTLRFLQGLREDLCVDRVGTILDGFANYSDELAEAKKRCESAEGRARDIEARIQNAKSEAEGLVKSFTLLLPYQREIQLRAFSGRLAGIFSELEAPTETNR